MSIPSKEKLAQALEAVGDTALDPMIRRAREGYYSDFESPLDFPCIILVRDLLAFGQNRLADQAQNGEFDATREESDAWAASPEGQATFRDLLGGR